MSVPALSTLATFDDIRRCIQVLTDGQAEEEFLRVLRLQEKFRQECLSTAQETQRIQKELDASLQSMADLETKLFHARRLLEMESKARREAEHERDQMEKKIVAVADLLQHERHLKDETKDKLAFLNTLPRKRRSMNPHPEEKYGNEINSTGSFLSDLSITQSEDDFLDMRHSRTWQKHRPSLSKTSVPLVGSKRTRRSVGGDNLPHIGAHSTPPPPPPPVPRRRSRQRRSGVGVQQHTLDMAPNAERFCATTKVTIPQNGSGTICAESKIEAMPLHMQIVEAVVEPEPTPLPLPRNTPERQLRTSTLKEPTAPPMTPAGPAAINPKTTQLLHMASPVPQQLRPTMLRQHNFSQKTFIRADTCVQCQKKIRFGAVGLRCRECPIRCHVDCRYLLTVSCVPQTGTPTLKGLTMGYISEHAPNVSPMIPALIVHCVCEIETRGLSEVGIYRVSGSEREVKALKERFLRGKGTPHLASADVHVLCGCVKDFLRSLREPLIPVALWKDFCNAAQNPEESEIARCLYAGIDALPQANRDTLAFLILHFQRIADCPEILMPIENIARVFGPTIVGYSSPDPDQHAIFTEVYTQYTVMLNLLKIPGLYWTQYVQLEATEKENCQNGSTLTRTPSHNKDTPYSLYATPLKSTLKKRKFYGTPPTYPHKK